MGLLVCMFGGVFWEVAFLEAVLVALELELHEVVKALSGKAEVPDWIGFVGRGDVVVEHNCAELGDPFG